MKVAVTGASGYIGRHVLAALLQAGVRPLAITRDPARLSGFGQAVDILPLDLAHCQATDVARLGQPDVLLHLAWDGLPNYRSLRHVEAELPQQYRFLNLMVQAGLPSLVVTGSCLEYGLQEGALREAQPTEPTTAYGLAKDTLRRMLGLLQEASPFAFTWARLFYSYGEGQSGNSLYPALQACLQRGEPTFRMSGGAQVRDFLPVERQAAMLVAAALSGRELGTVNLCSGQPRTVRSMVEAWIEASGRTVALDLGYYPYPDYEPMSFWGDRTRWDSLMNHP